MLANGSTVCTHRVRSAANTEEAPKASWGTRDFAWPYRCDPAVVAIIALVTRLTARGAVPDDQQGLGVRGFW